MLSLEEIKNIEPEKYQRNDIGTSKLFLKCYENKVIYVTERKAFFVYTGKRWELDTEDLKVHELAKDFALAMMNYFKEIAQENDEILKYYSSYCRRERRVKLIQDAKSINPVSFEIFDRQPYLFNCQNCTVDLVTGNAHEHSADDYLSMISNVEYVQGAKSPEFEKFVNEVMEGNQEMIDYLKRSLGYSLSAATFQECFFITYGNTTRNGKGTLNSVMVHLLGDYAKSANYESFANKKYASSGTTASEDIARLSGARYVAVSEPAEGMVLDAALIKKLSGNDTLTARNLYEKSFEFVAAFKIWINTNHLPIIRDLSVFDSERLQLFSFNRHFAPDEQDRGLKARLTSKENISGAFNWCMEGFQLMAAEGGIKMPKSIRKEIDAYRDDNDIITEFLADCFVDDYDASHTEKFSAVYRLYSNWCKDSGYLALGKKRFKTKLFEHMGIKRGTDNVDLVVGYAVKEDIPKEWLAKH